MPPRVAAQPALNRLRVRLPLILGLVLGLAAIAVLAGAPHPAGAQTTPSCRVLPATPTVAMCSFLTTVGTTSSAGPPAVAGTPSVAPGGTMTIALTNPSALSNPPGALISGISGLPNGCVVAGAASPSSGSFTISPATETVTISCAVASLGIPFQTAIGETVLLPAGVQPQFITETVVYNANGAATAVSSFGTCGSLDAMTGAMANCNNTPTSQIGAGGTLNLAVTATVPGQTFQITNAPGFVGTCPLTTTLPSPPTPAASATVSYACSTGEATQNPTAAIVITLTNGTPPVAGAPSELTTCTGTCTAPSAPPVQTTGMCPVPLPGNVGAVTTCSNTPTVPTVAGSTLALVVTAATSQTISITNAPPAAGGCPLTTPLPTSVSFPGSSVAVAYTCPNNQSTGPPAPALQQPLTVTVTNGNGAPGPLTELTTANAPAPACAATPPFPCVPAPTTVEVTLTVTSIAATAAAGFTASITAEGANSLQPGQLVTFLVQASTPNVAGGAGATIASFQVNFGDGTPPQIVLPSNKEPAVVDTITHTFPRPGVFFPTLLATDSTGASALVSTQVNLQQTISYQGLYNPFPAALIQNGVTLKVTDLNASPTLAATTDAVTVTFAVSTQFNPAQSVGLSVPSNPTIQTLSIDFGDGSGPQALRLTPLMVTSASHFYASPGTYTITVTATDSAGNTAVAITQVVITQPVAGPPPTS